MKLNLLIIIGLAIFLLPKCSNNNGRDKQLSDTTVILNKIINNSYFLKEHYNKKDSLYITQNKKINQSLRLTSPYFKIGYLINNRNPDIVDFSPTSFEDKRTRLVIPVLSIKYPIAIVALVVYKGSTHYEYKYKLEFKNGDWDIIDKERKKY